MRSSDTIYYQLSAPLDDITNNIAPDILSSEFVYLYDDVGNRTDMGVTGTLGTTGTFEYDYNDIYELEGVSNADSHSYAYDNVGNRTTVDSVSYTTNSLNEYTAVGATSFMYDGNDNLSYDGTNSYTYDEANRLISASNSSHSASYEYDAFNRRVSKTVDSVTTYYVYDSNEVIEEYNSSNVLQADYVMGSRIDEPLTMTRSSTTYYYNTDGLGSGRQVLNSSGTIVESYDYDPYGNVTIYNSSLTDITSSGSGIDNPYMFTGRRFDEETGIYHYRRRNYDPGIGRFLQRDPLGYYDSMNLYEYVGSNPVNYVDPMGLDIVVPPWLEKPVVQILKLLGTAISVPNLNPDPYVRQVLKPIPLLGPLIAVAASPKELGSPEDGQSRPFDDRKEQLPEKMIPCVQGDPTCEYPDFCSKNPDLCEFCAENPEACWDDYDDSRPPDSCPLQQ